MDSLWDVVSAICVVYAACDVMVAAWRWIARGKGWM
jgi:hypothetical protein